MALGVLYRGYPIRLQVAAAPNAEYQAVRFDARLAVALYEWEAEAIGLAGRNETAVPFVAVVTKCVNNCIFAHLPFSITQSLDCGSLG